MPRPSSGLTEYLQLAEQLNLKFDSQIVPGHIKDKTSWICLNCNSPIHKSYHQLKYNTHPCRCRNGMSLKLRNYTSLAEKLGLFFVGTHVPRNVFQETEWLTKDNLRFSACYHDLGYGKIPLKLREFVKNA